MEQPWLGTLLLTLGGLAGGSFYVPLRKVSAWAWETYWLVMGVIAWLLLPAMTAWLTVPDLPAVLCQSSLRSVLLAYAFGAMWGIGAVTFGLSMRYLGISLGMAVVVGLCAACGTLVPPMVDGQLGALAVTTPGITVLAGVGVCLAGIAMCGCAGVRKEKELTERQKQESIREFALAKGFMVAAISGLASAGMVYGIHAGRPIAQAAIAAGTGRLYQNSPVFVVVMAGGFTVNSIYCLGLGAAKGSLGQYTAGSARRLVANYALVGLAAALWYAQFLFYGMGTTMLGCYAFSSWAILTAVVLVFSTLWGLALGEWSGVSLRTMALIWGSVVVLALSTLVINLGQAASLTEADTGARSVATQLGQAGSLPCRRLTPPAQACYTRVSRNETSFSCSGVP